MAMTDPDSCPLSDPSAPLPAAVRRVDAIDLRPDQPPRRRDLAVATEVPVALVFNDISHAVMMASPADLEDFALGFALSEGIVADTRACLGIEVRSGTLGVEVHVSLSTRAFTGLKERRRNLAGRTGCGLCGTESLAALDLDVPPVERPPWSQDIAFDTVRRAMQAMTAGQTLNADTRGVHAAAWVLPDGSVVQVMEDIGRHNALDKLIGWRARQRPSSRVPSGFVAMSSRASYELVRKCARVDIPALATVSAPSSLAIDLAGRAGLALFSFCREHGMSRVSD